MTRVAICTPTISRPYPQYLASLEAEVPLLDAAGLVHGTSNTVANPYISGARAQLLRNALDWKADIICFLDHDISWAPGDLLKLIQTPGDVVAGTYRFKKPEEEYMATWEVGAGDVPIGRKDGCLLANRVPAGFLKVTKEAVAHFMTGYPHLCYGTPYNYSVDLFNHGAHKGVWWGEDYAFSRNWCDIGGKIWLVPDLNLTHHGTDEAFPGNLHQFLMRQPGGAADPNRDEPIYQQTHHPARLEKPIWAPPEHVPNWADTLATEARMKKEAAE
jgi:hypothetical protein